MTSLYAIVLNGTPINQLGAIEPGALSGLPAYVIANAEPAGAEYVDISSIPNWHLWGRFAGGDYKFVRQEIKLLTAASGFLNLPPQEKFLAGIYFVIGETARDLIFTPEEQIMYGFHFHRKSTESRENRMLFALMAIYNRLERADWQEAINEMTTDNLIDAYLHYGWEGNTEGDPAGGLFDYIDARVGTPYNGAKGFRGKGYTPRHGWTLDQLTDRLLDILKNGNYGAVQL